MQHGAEPPRSVLHADLQVRKNRVAWGCGIHSFALIVTLRSSRFINIWAACRFSGVFLNETEKDQVSCLALVTSTFPTFIL